MGNSHKKHLVWNQ